MVSNRTLFGSLLAQTSEAPIGLEIERAEGIYLYAPDGRRYCDLISGISVSNLGHGRPEVINAIKDQADRHMHLMVYGEYIQSPQVRLAEALVRNLPESLDNVYLTNSGSEAIDGALKLAKRYTGRREIIAFRHAYHGHTQGALSVMGDETWKRRFRPLLPGITFLEFNNTEDLEKIIIQTACVLIEPVQGEAGVITPREGFLEDIRRKCTETGSLLIFDEVQTGFGRTGQLFAFQKYGVIPDVLVLAKALGAGMPLGAFIASREIMAVLANLPPLGHITTFGGHPVSCAAALAGLKVLLGEEIIQTVEKKSALFRDLLSGHRAVKEFRHSGLLMAMELENESAVHHVISHCLEKDVILDWFLFRPSAVRLAPPLVITENQIAEVCQVIVSALDLL
ncbi:MAG: aspartate aminotransferase family protein [Bacteroidetes bacterium]|nr:aspartate aminotransferase family protein [Bacteroidota bacterium]